MKNKPGAIYFIKELSPNPHDFPLVKMGLVYNDRSPYDRLKDHQTSNPRRLSLSDEYIVHTDAVSFVEAQLLNRFSEKTVAGEWKQFGSEKDLQVAISKADELAEEMAGNRSLFEQAETLEQIPDNGKTIPATQETIYHATRLAIAKHKIKICNSLDKQIKEKIKVAVDSGANLKGAAKTSTRNYKATFEEENFEKSHPDLYRTFLVDSFSWYQRFLLDSKLKKSVSIEMESDSEEFLTKAKEIEVLTENTTSKDEAYLLNEPVLLLKQLRAIADYDEEISEVKLKVACDQNLFIDGLCKWERYNKVREIFDEPKFIKQHHELYLDYLTDPETKTYIMLSNTRNN
jgi:hypothetical protein